MFLSLVAGLGNPGRVYDRTRHNLGWEVLDAFARKHGLAWSRSPQFEADVARWDVAALPTRWLVKPSTFMNHSGRAVAAVARFFKVQTSAVVAVHDDLAIDTGFVKISVAGSAGGHNGVASMIEHIGDGFTRYRLGIGPKEPAQMELSDYVLGKFTPHQQTIVTQKIDYFVSGLELLLNKGVDPAMNQLNRRDPK